MNKTIITLLCSAIAIATLQIACSKDNAATSKSNLSEVKIGNQIWTAKNLDVERYRNGDLIPQVTDSIQWKNLTTGAWCYYNNDPNNGTIYGKLYNWYAVNDPRGLAPQGWRIPNDQDWSNLLKYIDPSSNTTLENAVQSTSAGGALKEIGLTNWITPNTSATNTSGFTALPGGYRNGNAGFVVKGRTGGWWSANAKTATVAWSYFIFNDNANVSKLNGTKSIGCSIRLVKD